MNEEQRARGESTVAPFRELSLDVWTGEALRWEIQLLRDDIERLKREVREATLDEVQEFVVAHAFDTTVGRKIDDFITALLDANKE